MIAMPFYLDMMNGSSTIFLNISVLFRCKEIAFENMRATDLLLEQYYLGLCCVVILAYSCFNLMIFNI